MKLVCVSACVLLLAGGAPAAGQQPNEAILSSIDSPGPGASVPASTFVETGWAFYCSTGEHPLPPRVTVRNLATGANVNITAGWSIKDHLEREDVYNSYRGMCPKVHKYEGWELRFLPTLPPGRYRVTIDWDVIVTDSVPNTDVLDVTLTAG